MRGNVITGHLHFIHNVTKSDQNKFCNMLVYAAVKVPRGVVCVVPLSAS